MGGGLFSVAEFLQKMLHLTAEIQPAVPRQRRRERHSAGGQRGGTALIPFLEVLHPARLFSGSGDEAGGFVVPGVAVENTGRVTAAEIIGSYRRIFPIGAHAVTDYGNRSGRREIF